MSTEIWAAGANMGRGKDGKKAFNGKNQLSDLLLQQTISHPHSVHDFTNRTIFFGSKGAEGDGRKRKLFFGGGGRGKKFLNGS